MISNPPMRLTAGSESGAIYQPPVVNCVYEITLTVTDPMLEEALQAINERVKESSETVSISFPSPS